MATLRNIRFVFILLNALFVTSLVLALNLADARLRIKSQDDEIRYILGNVVHELTKADQRQREARHARRHP